LTGRKEEIEIAKDGGRCSYIILLDISISERYFSSDVVLVEPIERCYNEDYVH
jgi:hypothetical protein